MDKLKIAIVTNVLPTYREGFYNRLFADKRLAIEIFCQSELLTGSKLKTIHQKYSNVRVVKFFTLKGEFLNWQFLPFLKLLKNYDVVFVDGNPRYVSHFLIANLLKIFRRKVVLWTMAHTYNANKYSENLRLTWTKIFKYLFVYNDNEVVFLRNRGFKEHTIIGMNNGLDQKKIDSHQKQWSIQRLDDWKKDHNIANKQILLSCTRLIEKNKLIDFLNLMPSIISVNADVHWYIVGDGDQKPILEEKIQSLKLEEHVHLLGGIYDEELLAPWFMTAKVLIHPASIGLSILHAFGYGLPVITHGSAYHHGPEFSALVDGENSLCYEEDNWQDLKIKLQYLLENENIRKQFSKKAIQTVRENYNVDIMVERFLEMIFYITGEKRLDKRSIGFK